MLDANQVKEQLTPEDIIRICTDLQGDDYYAYDNQGNLIFNTCLDHEGGDSFKLYYYPSTQKFYCWTSSSSYDIYELVRRAKGLQDFSEAFIFVVKYFHIRDDGTEKVEKTDDWAILNKAQRMNNANSLDRRPIKPINPSILEYYAVATPCEWLKEGICGKAIAYYGIRIDTACHHIIIPHYSEEGDLIGIRRRTFDPFEIEHGKYTPVLLEGTMYNHPLGDYLYGLYHNMAAIKKYKKVIVFEAEKSVLQLASYVGAAKNFSVATCGSSITKNQIKLLLSLGVDEIILAYDREFEGHRGSEDTVQYERKLAKVLQPLVAFVKVSVIMDYDHLTGYKDSPTDKGLEIFKKLLKQKIKVTTDNNYF